MLPRNFEVRPVQVVVADRKAAVALALSLSPVGTGAGAAAGIDALIQGRKTIYLAPARSSARLRLSPMLLRNAKGVRVSLLFENAQVSRPNPA
jgi:hypothetical protein